ncbi:hypothetical protein PG985_013004 [Apiospora marii]|uniref:Uncharacterized protein n=1 Tax=Apiospora marii TaxID=335849 RepID=A0ABR1RBP1_9PEZI
MASNDPTIPSVCYATCTGVALTSFLLDDALLEAQRQGKTPALCRAGSAFREDVQRCNECMQDHNAANVTDSVALQPIGSYLNYCNTNGTVSQAPTDTDTVSVEITTIGTNTARMVTTNVMITTELGGHSTVLTTLATYPSFFLVPVTTLVTTAATLVDGRPIPLLETPRVSEFYHPKWRGPFPVPRLIQPIVNTPAPTPPPPAAAQSMAWVAGPAVGGVAAIVILALLAFWWRRRRHRREHGAADGTTQEIDGKEKPELAGPEPGVNQQGNTARSPQDLEAGGPYRIEDNGIQEIEGTQTFRSGNTEDAARIPRTPNQ